MSTLEQLVSHPSAGACFERFLQSEYGEATGADVWQSLTGDPKSVDAQSVWRQFIEGPSRAAGMSPSELSSFGGGGGGGGSSSSSSECQQDADSSAGGEAAAAAASATALLHEAH